jgi:hypothetical protein
MNASVTMRQAGQSKKMAEARLSVEERKTIFPFLKCVYIFWHPLCVCVCVYTHTHTYIHVKVVMKMVMDVSKEHTASIFRGENGI